MDELAHLIRQIADQTAGEYRPHLFGHIASYDPLTHRVRCMIPSLGEENGDIVLSPWMPLGVPFGGQGFGFQYIYAGGASPTNPTAGEQVLIAHFDKARGVAAVPCMFYHGNVPPPATNLPLQKDGYPADAAPNATGDILISNPPATQGGVNSMLRFRASGDIEVWGCTNLSANIIGGAIVTAVNGDVDIVASKGNVVVTALNGTATVAAKAIELCAAIGDALQTLCTKALRDWAATHTHANGPQPTTQPPANALTKVVTAE